MKRDLNKIAKKIYEANKAKGFHDVEYSNDHYLMLVITELSEAVEADRKGCRANTDQYVEWMNGYTPEDSPIIFEHAFLTNIKGTIEEKLADAAIRLFDLAGLRKIQNMEIYVNEPDHCNLSFCEDMYYIVYDLINRNRYAVIRSVIENTINQIFKLSMNYGIDLWWYIELKLQYNKTRPERHGKKY